MRFAPEAWGIVLPVLGGALVALLFAFFLKSDMLVWVAVFIVMIACTLLLFFRDPVRKPPNGKGLVVAPADGKVIEVETLPDGRQHAAIFLSVFNVHVNRTPIACTVENVTEKPGTYFHAGSEQAKQQNARIDVAAHSEYGAVAWRQLSGLLARKISCRVKAGDVLRTGETFGLIYFGSRMDVYLPPSAHFSAHVGQSVTAGETVIATFLNEDKL